MKTRTILLTLISFPTGIILLMGENGMGFLVLLIGILSGISVMQEKKQSKE